MNIIKNRINQDIITPSNVQALQIDQRKFGLVDVSDCNSVNEVIEKLDLGNYTKENIPEVCQGYARILDDRNNPIAFVNQSYDLLQPLETFAFMDAMGHNLGIKYTKAGFTHGGRRMFIEAEYGEIEVAKQKGDILKRKLTATGSFDGSLSTQFNFSFLRLICTNGMANWIADKASKISIRHTRNQRAIMAQAIEQATGIKQVFVNLENDINKLQQTHCGALQMYKIATQYFGVGEDLTQETTRVANNIEAIMDQFTNAERGAHGRTAFDALNAFTAWTTHERTSRETKDTSRSENQYRFTNNEFHTKKFRNIIGQVCGI